MPEQMKNREEEGTLFLLPMMLGGEHPDSVIPAHTQKRIVQMTCLIVEQVRTARRYLKMLDQSVDIDAITFFELNKHTKSEHLDTFLDPIFNGRDVGLLSEAGLPCLADPGSQIVARAHRRNIRVVPLSGPSSMIMALIASGLNGQNFAFNGYLPVQQKERAVAIRRLEKRAREEKQSQIFMETPYRNNQLLMDVIRCCSGGTLLTVAVDVTTSNEWIKTCSVNEWKDHLPDIHKRPAVFVIY